MSGNRFHDQMIDSNMEVIIKVSPPNSPRLPGKAYARRQHMWLTGANEADSKVFSRAILAKSACIQTVVCIPVLEGVLELGTTERVQEDSGLIKLAKSFFLEELDSSDVGRRAQQVPKPALSEQSTSNPASVDPTCFQSSPPFPTTFTALDLPSMGEADDHRGKKQEEEEEEDDQEDEDEEESDSEAGTGKYGLGMKNNYPSHDVPAEETAHLWASSQISDVDPPPSQPVLADQPSELMQMEMSEDIRLGSPEDYSNAALDAEIQILDAGVSGRQAADPQQFLESYRVDPGLVWQPPQEAVTAAGDGVVSGDLVPMEEVLTQEDTLYFQTVSGILETNASRWANSPHSSSAAAAAYLGGYPHQSAFVTWTNFGADPLLHPAGDSSQRVLKYVLFTVPLLHTAKSPDEGATRSSFRKTSTPQDEVLSANHVLAERRRREKLNERFIVLRSLVPFVTRMDKASILGDTIEYVKQLRKRIQDLESRTCRNPEVPDPRQTTGRKSPSDQPAGGNGRITTAGANVSGIDAKRKVRVVEGGRGVAPVNNSLQVSIIENDALLELQCPDREGLLLEVMQTMHRVRMEVTAVQSSSTNGVIVANLRAKVKEKVNGKKASIVEVKKAIHQIIPQH